MHSDVPPFPILPQPDETTCGPTCLQAIYRYFGEDIPLDRVIEEVPTLEEGGTLCVLLARHALRRGYRAALYPYDLKMFDPTWFGLDRVRLIEKLRAQLSFRNTKKLAVATSAYVEFLERGGGLRFTDLSPGLLKRYLSRSTPILAALSATYLYGCPREYGPRNEYDDIRGEPVGHFVVLYGYDRYRQEVLVADPYVHNPYTASTSYTVSMHRLIVSILLGTLTFDGRLLILTPPKRKKAGQDAHADRRHASR